MSTHKERVLSQKPTTKVKNHFFLILETNNSGHGKEG